MNPHISNRNEAGTSTVSILVAMALGTVLIGGLFAFLSTATAQSTRSAQSASSQSEVVQSANRLGRDISDAHSIRMVTPSEVTIDTGYGLVRWSVDEDGTLIKQTTADRALTDWEGIDGQVNARGIHANAFELVGTNLVTIDLRTVAGNAQIVTAASLMP